MGILNEYEEVLIGNRKKYPVITLHLIRKATNELLSELYVML